MIFKREQKIIATDSTLHKRYDLIFLYSKRPVFMVQPKSNLPEY